MCITSRWYFDNINTECMNRYRTVSIPGSILFSQIRAGPRSGLHYFSTYSGVGSKLDLTVLKLCRADNMIYQSIHSDKELMVTQSLEILAALKFTLRNQSRIF